VYSRSNPIAQSDEDQEKDQFEDEEESEDEEYEEDEEDSELYSCSYNGTSSYYVPMCVGSYYSYSGSIQTSSPQSSLSYASYLSPMTAHPLVNFSPASVEQ
jgi:hypothetical protein